MVKFLKWMGAIALGTLNGFAKLFLGIVVIVAVVAIVGLVQGDGLPDAMVLSLDLRNRPADSAPADFAFGPREATVMDIVLNLEAAGSDTRVKGVYVRLGSGDLGVAQAEEIAAAFKRFRAKGKFVIVHSQGFLGNGLGDYVTASAGSQIWMQPKSPFLSAGETASRFYLHGLLNKIGVEAQFAKRADYKSAPETLTADAMSAPDREQTAALLQSRYRAALNDAAAARKVAPAKLAALFDASAQSAETVKKAGLIDRIGYDDDAERDAKKRAGAEAETVAFAHYAAVRSAGTLTALAPRIAVVEVCGEIVDGGSGGNPFTDDSARAGGDDIAGAIRDAAADSSIKAIVLRIDSPGGSVTASDQIWDAVNKARKSGKPVVVSMGSVAASGGYYVAMGADRIVAEPATVTGSIGVFAGKIAIDRTLKKIGVGVAELGVGRNALMNSPITPFTDEQLKTLDTQVGDIYADFTAKVAAGRKMPPAKVQDVAKGRVWSGTDAKANGLVDRLGGFWTAVEEARKLSKIEAKSKVAYVVYPQPKGLIETLQQWFGGASVAARALTRLSALVNAPAVRETVAAMRSAPQGGIELRDVNLPD
jgi:protease IV